MITFMFFLAKANPDFVLEKRYQDFLANVRDLAYTVISDDSVRYGYYWASPFNAYRINVVKDKEGLLQFSHYYIMKDGTLYKVQYNPLRVEENISFLTLEHLYAYNWVAFPLKCKWVKSGSVSEFEFEKEGIKGSIFIDEEGKLRKVLIKHPGITYEIVYTNYTSLGDFKHFPSEWDFIIGEEKKQFKILEIFLNKGMCGPCTFKIPQESEE